MLCLKKYPVYLILVSRLVTLIPNQVFSFDNLWKLKKKSTCKHVKTTMLILE